MLPTSFNVVDAEDALGELAMRFRGTRADEERRKIAADYSTVVERLIDSGHWKAMPSPEDQLPSEWMPDAFFQYWMKQLGAQ